MIALLIQHNGSSEAHTAPLRRRTQLRAALGELWRAAQARRRMKQDLARLLDADERILRDIGIDRWTLRRALSSGALPPLCTAFEPGGDR